MWGKKDEEVVDEVMEGSQSKGRDPHVILCSILLGDGHASHASGKS